MLVYSCRHIFVANSHNVYKLTPLPYEVQVQQLVQQQQYELAMQICVSTIVCMCPRVCVYLYACEWRLTEIQQLWMAKKYYGVL